MRSQSLLWKHCETSCWKPVLHDATLKKIVAIVAESRTRFYFVQRLVQLVSQRFWPLHSMLHGVMVRATCLATALRGKLHEKLHRACNRAFTRCSDDTILKFWISHFLTVYHIFKKYFSENEIIDVHSLHLPYLGNKIYNMQYFEEDQLREAPFTTMVLRKIIRRTIIG